MTSNCSGKDALGEVLVEVNKNWRLHFLVSAVRNQWDRVERSLKDDLF